MKARILVALVCWSACATAQTIDASAARRSRWNQDIDAFVQGFSARGSTLDAYGVVVSRGELDFEKLYPKKKFNSEISDLKRSINAMSDADIVLELARIVAEPHVAHTSVEWPTSMGFEFKLPLIFDWLSDGMILFAAPLEHQQEVGQRVARIGSMTPEELQRKLAPLISCENEQCSKERGPTLMILRPVLNALHLIDEDGGVTLTLDRTGGLPLEIKVFFTNYQQPMIGVGARSAITSPLKPTENQRHLNYWYRYFPEYQAAYIQYRVCAEDPKMAFADFVRTMMGDLDVKPVRRIVIDLRANGGGDSGVIRPLIEALKGHPVWSGEIYVLIGPDTFSAAMMNAMRLKRELHATLVGEPTGGKPSFYGEVRFLTLPNSKLKIGYSTRYTAADKGMDGKSLFPDIPASMSKADLLAGRDPAFNLSIQIGTLRGR